jgi:hypothetical protein
VLLIQTGSVAMALDSVVTGRPDRTVRHRSQPADVSQESFTKANDFTGSSRAGAGVGKPVPITRLRWAVIATISVEVFWWVWLALVGKGASPCAGHICMVTTLEHHAAALPACGASFVAALGTLVPDHRPRFLEIQRHRAIAVTLAAAAGGVSLPGTAPFSRLHRHDTSKGDG